MLAESNVMLSGNESVQGPIDVEWIVLGGAVFFAWYFYYGLVYEPT